MVPLMGLKILVVLLKVTLGWIAIVAVTVAALVSTSRRRWARGHPARFQRYASAGLLTWSVLWMVVAMATAPPVAGLAWLPLFACIATYAWISSTERERGFRPPNGGALAGAVVGALGLAGALLSVVRAANDVSPP